MAINPVYIVSGWMRSGTSMMMQALEAGGMDVVYDDVVDMRMERWGDPDYHPNPGGLYELHPKRYLERDFPDMYRGKCIKMLTNNGRVNCRPQPIHGIKVLWMERSAHEIQKSYARLDPAHTVVPVEEIEHQCERSLEHWANRRDTEIWVIRYAVVLNEPYEAFLAIKEQAGWPFDPKKAAEIVTPELYRNREVERLGEDRR